MAQIENIIEALDSNAAGAMQVYVYRPKYSDVPDLQGPLSDLFGSGSPSATSSQLNVLALRASQAIQSSGPTTLGIPSSAGGSSGGRSGQ
jgi:hypothetical protein